jgi:peptidoglycan/LPS O-acetylase OafA/YrhL
MIASTAPSAPTRRVYDTLDGLRAAGAQLVVARHLGEFFGYVRVPESFLAVDLFYLVSGVVVANAYGKRLERGGMNLRTFFVTRLIRLYPLYLAGLGIGLAAALLNMRHDPAGWWTQLKILEAIGTGLLMIPMLPGLQATGSSFDGPVWTLIPELASNIVWAGIIRWFRPALVGLCLLVGGAGVVWAEFHFHTLDVGFAADQLGAGLARGLWSFFAGTVVVAIVGRRRIDSNVVPWICVAILTAILAWPYGLWPLAGHRAGYEIVVVLALFPALIGVAAMFEPGPRVARLFALIGRASWGVYILHEPVARLLEETLLRHWRPPTGPAALAVGLGYLVLVNSLAWALDRWFETPVRKVLSIAFGARRVRPLHP